MFSNLPTPVLDPILSLSVAYRNDDRPNKVDLGIGVYKNSAGETPIMKAIQMAQDVVVETQKTKSFPTFAPSLGLQNIGFFEFFETVQAF